VRHDEIRVGDVLARWGGEEFLLMMPAADARSVGRLGAHSVNACCQPRWDDLAPGLVVTFSAGVAGCDDESDMERAIERADVLCTPPSRPAATARYGPAPRRARVRCPRDFVA